MRRLAPLALIANLLLTSFAVGCTGGRDAHDVASDFEGTISAPSAERVLRDVDLSRAPVEVSAGNDLDQTFGRGDQTAFEQFVRDAAAQLAGDTVRVTQQVVDDTGSTTQRLSATLEVQHQGETLDVPIAVDLLRDGRRMVVTRIRVMSAGSALRAPTPGIEPVQ